MADEQSFSRKKKNTTGAETPPPVGTPHGGFNPVDPQGLTLFGKLGEGQVGQVDVRTDFMRQLEQAVLPMLLGLFGSGGASPFAFAQSAQGAMPGFGQGAGGLLDFLLGGGVGAQAPPGGGGGGQPPPGGGNQPPPRGGQGVTDTTTPRTGFRGTTRPADPGETSAGAAPPPGFDILQRLIGAGMPGQFQYGSNGWTTTEGPTGRQLPINPAGHEPMFQQFLSQFPWANFQDWGSGGWQNDPRLVQGSQYGTAGPLPVNPLAGGGPLDPNKLNLVGEAGPEMIYGNQVIPLGQQMNSGQFQMGNAANAAGAPGYMQALLGNNPEQQALGTANQFLTGAGGQGGLLGSAPGASVIGAMEPVFRRNLDYSLQGLRNLAPNVFGSGLARTGNDVSQQAMENFNLQSAQAGQQGVSQQIQGLSQLPQFAQAAGQNPFARSLGAGQFGLQSQQQAWDQTMGPTLQLLLAAMGMAGPTGMQTVIGPGAA